MVERCGIDDRLFYDYNNIQIVFCFERPTLVPLTVVFLENGLSFWMKFCCFNSGCASSKSLNSLESAKKKVLN